MSGNLLIVDDEPQICNALTRLLRADGYSISHALNPVEGLQLMQEQPFDVVLSDYMMPGVNGVEFLSQVSQSFPHTVRLMLSGQADMSAVIDAINSGSIFKFILKPWSNDGLRNTIREAFQQSAEKTQAFDGESGWLTRTRFIDQYLPNTTGALLVVGEWVNAANCLIDISTSNRRAVYDILEDRITTTLDLTGKVAMVEQATFACIAADEMSELQWQTLNAELSKPINIESAGFRGKFKLGLSRFDGNELKIALKQALIAVSAATTGTYQRYTGKLGSQVHRRKTLESDLHHAIERKELYFDLQPQLSTTSQQIVSAESLLRWRHPRLGLVSPLDVIDMAEQSELINDIGYWIAQECCALLQTWQQTSNAEHRLSVNVSPRQFLTGDVIADIATLIKRHDIDPSLLEVEVTESCIMSDPEQCANGLERLSDIGVRIALDDFGTGYSSLATLRQLPIDVLKIDRSFISELKNENSAAHTLLQHIVSLAKSLHLSVVAEGIETIEQANMCTTLGCDLLQGYYISRPISVDDFSALTAQR